MLPSEAPGLGLLLRRSPSYYYDFEGIAGRKKGTNVKIPTYMRDSHRVPRHPRHVLALVVSSASIPARPRSSGVKRCSERRRPSSSRRWTPCSSLDQSTPARLTTDRPPSSSLAFAAMRPVRRHLCGCSLISRRSETRCAVATSGALHRREVLVSSGLARGQATAALSRWRSGSPHVPRFKADHSLRPSHPSSGAKDDRKVAL